MAITTQQAQTVRDLFAAREYAKTPEEKSAIQHAIDQAARGGSSKQVAQPVKDTSGKVVGVVTAPGDYVATGSGSGIGGSYQPLQPDAATQPNPKTWTTMQVIESPGDPPIQPIPETQQSIINRENAVYASMGWQGQIVSQGKRALGGILNAPDYLYATLAPYGDFLINRKMSSIKNIATSIEKEHENVQIKGNAVWTNLENKNYLEAAKGIATSSTSTDIVLPLVTGGIFKYISLGAKAATVGGLAEKGYKYFVNPATKVIQYGVLPVTLGTDIGLTAAQNPKALPRLGAKTFVQFGLMRVGYKYGSIKTANTQSIIPKRISEQMLKAGTGYEPDYNTYTGSQFKDIVDTNLVRIKGTLKPAIRTSTSYEPNYDFYSGAIKTGKVEPLVRIKGTLKPGTRTMTGFEPDYNLYKGMIETGKVNPLVRIKGTLKPAIRVRTGYEPEWKLPEIQTQSEGLKTILAPKLTKTKLFIDTDYLYSGGSQKESPTLFIFGYNPRTQQSYDYGYKYASTHPDYKQITKPYITTTPVTKLGLINIISSDILSDQTSKSGRELVNITKSDLLSNQVQDNISRQIQDFNQNTIQNIIQNQIQTPTLDVVQTSIQIRNQIQNQIQNQMQNTTQETRQTEEQTKIFKLPTISTGMTKEVEKSLKGYNVFIKERHYFKGKKKKPTTWFKASKYPLTKEQALALGSTAVNETAAASFKIIPTEGQPKNLGFSVDSWGNLSGNFYMKGNTFIEKTPYRINTSGEIKGISALGWLAQRQRSYQSPTKIRYTPTSNAKPMKAIKPINVNININKIIRGWKL
jgi:hypothetical protein